jgi:hypothetical protein
MSLDITIIEFLLGVVAGTLSCILIVKRTGRNTLLPRTTISRKIARTKPRTALKQARTRGARPRSVRRLRPPAQPSETLNVEPMVTTLAVNVSSCPTCGLQAPDALMAEHFLGSPSHENGTPEPEMTIIENAIFDKSQSLSAEEDAKSSLRSLLQMLVPPRAFGRRHLQRTVNPLSRMVQTIADAQGSLVRPLKGPL